MYRIILFDFNEIGGITHFLRKKKKLALEQYLLGGCFLYKFLFVMHTPLIYISFLFRYVTSDCDAVAIIYENQTYSSSPEESIADVLKAGVLDLFNILV